MRHLKFFTEVICGCLISIGTVTAPDKDVFRNFEDVSMDVDVGSTWNPGFGDCLEPDDSFVFYEECDTGVNMEEGNDIGLDMNLEHVLGLDKDLEEVKGCLSEWILQFDEELLVYEEIVESSEIPQEELLRQVETWRQDNQNLRNDNIQLLKQILDMERQNLTLIGEVVRMKNCLKAWETSSNKREEEKDRRRVELNCFMKKMNEVLQNKTFDNIQHLEVVEQLKMQERENQCLKDQNVELTKKLLIKEIDNSQLRKAVDNLSKQLPSSVLESLYKKDGMKYLEEKPNQSFVEIKSSKISKNQHKEDERFSSIQNLEKVICTSVTPTVLKDEDMLGDCRDEIAFPNDIMLEDNGLCIDRLDDFVILQDDFLEHFDFNFVDTEECNLIHDNVTPKSAQAANVTYKPETYSTIFSDVDNLSQYQGKHVKKKSTKYRSYNNDTSSKGQAEDYGCNVRHVVLLSAQAVRDHVRKHRGQKTCDKCGKVYCNAYFLNNHKQVEHVAKKCYQCNMCKQNFPNKRCLQRHQCVRTDNICNKPDVFAQKQHKIHSPLYKLDIIRKCEPELKVAYNKNLLKHKFSPKIVKCRVCRKVYRTNFCLKQHFRKHTGEKPFVCDICDKGFTRKGYLHVHERIHMAVKPFCCDICNKTFSQRIQCENHRRGHTGEKPFKCDTCEKMYSSKGKLLFHKRRHQQDAGYDVSSREIREY